MDKQHLLNNIESVATLAFASKFRRMLRQPVKYLRAIVFREFIYRKKRQEKEVVCQTFFKTKMNILLPASTDIYLLGGKSHFSEIKLAKFLINNLNTGHSFLDIGAHYGYFALLASGLVGKQGKVVAFEASPVTFKILEKNKNRVANLTVFNKAVSDAEIELTFYEFPNLYSEFNTLEIDQFEKESWFDAFEPQKIKVPSEQLDNYLEREHFNPEIIKIDVEGAEFKVLKGARKYLSANSPVIVMEYLSTERGNKEHVKAEDFLRSLNYSPNVIDESGALKPVSNIAIYLEENQFESDNIVFVRENPANTSTGGLIPLRK